MKVIILLTKKERKDEGDISKFNKIKRKKLYRLLDTFCEKNKKTIKN